MCAKNAFDHPDYVPVVVAHGADEAERLVELLLDHEIPATMGGEEDLLVAMEGEDPEDEAEGGNPDGAVVLVPSEYYDEASEILAAREDFGELGNVEDDEVEDDDEDEEISLQPHDLDDTLGDDDSPYDHQPDGGEEFEGLEFDFDVDEFDDEEDGLDGEDLDDTDDDDDDEELDL